MGAAVDFWFPKNYNRFARDASTRTGSDQWHADLVREPVPAGIVTAPEKFVLTSQVPIASNVMAAVSAQPARVRDEQRDAGTKHSWHHRILNNWLALRCGVGRFGGNMASLRPYRPGSLVTGRSAANYC